VFASKLALPENVLNTLLNDRLVAKGTVLDFITTFFQVRAGRGRAGATAERRRGAAPGARASAARGRARAARAGRPRPAPPSSLLPAMSTRVIPPSRPPKYQVYLSKESLDDLKTMLTKAKIVNRLEELMPPSKRGPGDFAAHFGAVGLTSLVEWNQQREMETKIAELRVRSGGALGGGWEGGAGCPVPATAAAPPGRCPSTNTPAAPLPHRRLPPTPPLAPHLPHPPPHPTLPPPLPRTSCPR
jgi:hypothetical protein